MGSSDERINQPVDLSSMTIEALKALAYDQLVLLNQTQANINAIQAEINKQTAINSGVIRTNA